GAAAPGAAVAPLGSTTRTALNWWGMYEGTLPCADCPGIRTRLTLMQDNTYQLQTQYLDRQAAPQTVQGRFIWMQDGVTIQLDAAGSNQRYLVGEQRLTLLYQDGSLPTGTMAQHYVLTRTSPR
ncbi:MAG: copper resistance protein NlpE, partial [Bordetella sp.]|nr:copper resistance protein NlpE [Bordetella sp.]